MKWVCWCCAPAAQTKSVEGFLREDDDGKLVLRGTPPGGSRGAQRQHTQMKWNADYTEKANQHGFFRFYPRKSAQSANPRSIGFLSDSLLAKHPETRN